MGVIVVANDGKKREDKSSIKSRPEPENFCDHQHSSYPWMACSCSVNTSPSSRKESQDICLPTAKTEASVSSLSLSSYTRQEFRHTSLPVTSPQALVSSLSLPEESIPQNPRYRSHSALQPEASVSNSSLPRGTQQEPVFTAPPQHYGRSNSYQPLDAIPQNHVRAISYQQRNVIPSAVQQYGRPMSYQHTSTVVASQSFNPLISNQQNQRVLPIAELEGSPAPPSMGQHAPGTRPQSVPLLPSSFVNQYSTPLNHQSSFMSTFSEPQVGNNTYPPTNFHSQTQLYSPSTVSSFSTTSTPATTYIPTPTQAYTPPPAPTPTPVPVPQPQPPPPINPQHLPPLLQNIQHTLLHHFLEKGGSLLPTPVLKAHATQTLQHQLKAPIILQRPVRDLETEACEEFERVREVVGRCLESMGIGGCVVLVPELGGGGGLCGVHVFPC